jgi:hypothetical protein
MASNSLPAVGNILFRARIYLQGDGNLVHCAVAKRAAEKISKSGNRAGEDHKYINRSIS